MTFSRAGDVRNSWREKSAIIGNGLAGSLPDLSHSSRVAPAPTTRRRRLSGCGDSVFRQQQRLNFRWLPQEQRSFLPGGRIPGSEPVTTNLGLKRSTSSLLLSPPTRYFR